MKVGLRGRYNAGHFPGVVVISGVDQERSPTPWVRLSSFIVHRDSTGQIAILPEDPAGIVGGQRLEFFDGNFGNEMGSPYFYPHKNGGS
ncbi:hypothetical protein KW849_08555 [Pseudomonas sp. PDM26]|uniref:hypothetical protein n=1 Tax=Pseudomonas sp. PDM26 TaxID=2854766 RepID=UPI001C4828F0|nr:hypothetical protein [Pseudomonas sp. PDM26]MBV7546346.1 hypothetical protein [Pseudomonas sp. PDM26]